MKLKKNKGKIFPSPTPNPNPSSSSSLDVLNLLPAAIFSMVLSLSFEDREVLAYLITKSTKINTGSGNSVIDCSGEKNHTEKHPVFDCCDCFNCYTSYWFRWDSSPNRELIHQAIEAFEDQLVNGQQSKKQTRGKRKIGTRPVVEKSVACDVTPVDVAFLPEFELEPSSAVVVYPQYEVEDSGGRVSEEVVMAEVVVVEELPTALCNTGTTGSIYKGLARKVLPDVIGLFNSRLWNLWSRNAC